ncbi:hypothetical protein NE237_022286 [Protea cynaroides]|uniref:Uncharacterized protein n=1 Tax=Protea cynaroides TaxID=273540 RepID=A0A9Q0H9G4_9MAGN|nr:hypothetical protein NE237_022286 [Protea cynaroides]
MSTITNEHNNEENRQSTAAKILADHPVIYAQHFHSYEHVHLLCRSSEVPVPPIAIKTQFISFGPNASKHRHLILNQKLASQALQTFRWGAKISDFTHNQSIREIRRQRTKYDRQIDIEKGRHGRGALEMS